MAGSPREEAAERGWDRGYAARRSYPAVDVDDRGVAVLADHVGGELYPEDADLAVMAALAFATGWHDASNPD